MTLVGGTRLGPYEILSAIGAGGMGEVYRAHDTHLKRDVALKILPSQLALDPERLARFDREAQALATLNHPHIAQIYGFAHEGDLRAIVMELVEGPTLAERIARGSVPVDEALPLAIQLADALEYAHERGIVHRDLKPANIKLTPDGAVKVLDFGLAKALAPAGASATADLTDSPTVTSPAAMTRVGVVLGTAAYMAPEQARGAAVDKRADIWAFGVVLFEMLTGKTCFAGETVTDVLAAVVKTEPDWSTLPPGTPPQLRQLLQRCLTKDRKQRLRDVGDAKLELEGTLAGPWLDAPKERPSPRWLARPPWFAAGLLLVALAGREIVWRWRVPVDVRPAVTREAIVLPPGDRIIADGPYGSATLAFSPDGGSVVYSAYRDEAALLFLRRLDAYQPQVVPGSEEGSEPFFSPDGRWLAFFARGKLWKTPMAGGALGAPIEICSVLQPLGGTWAPDGTIFFADGWVGDAIWSVSADGGTPKAAILCGSPPIWPQVTPSGKTVMFTQFPAGIRSKGIFAVPVSGGKPQLVLDDAEWGVVVPGGHLLFLRDKALFAVPFDADGVKIVGRERRVIEPFMVTQVPLVAVSSTGHLATVPPMSQETTLVWVERDGTVRPLSSPPLIYGDMALSPDGDRLAVQTQLPPSPEYISLYDLTLDRSPLTRLTHDRPDRQWTPSWSKDGTFVMFFSGEGRVSMSRAWPGSEQGEDVWSGDETAMLADVSPDGKWCVFNKVAPGKGWDIWLLELGGQKSQRPLLDSPDREVSPKISRDGRWMAYASSENGRFEVYVREFPSMTGKVQVSAEGGVQPRWSRTSSELFFQNGNRMMVARYRADKAGFVVTTRSELFNKRFHWKEVEGYDVSPDGRRLLMLQSTDPGATYLNMIANWADSLRNPR